MKALIKNLAYLLLPESILKRLKYIHHNRTVRLFPISEIPEYKIMSRLILPGSIVIDIGANIGIFTKCFSSLAGSKGRVYSLEPVPQTYDILCSNIEHLHFDNVIPLDYAASDSEATVIMTIPTYQSNHAVDSRGFVYEGNGDNFYEAMIIREDEISPSSKQVLVQTKTLDSLFADNTSMISFIKCDVEGHELQAILGSLSIIRRDKPALLIEVMDNPINPATSAYQLFQILDNEGYKPFYLEDGFLKPAKLKTHEINFFFLTPRHLTLLDLFIG